MAFTQFDMKVYNKGYESDFEDEPIEMHMDLEANVLFRIENLNENCSILNTATKYPKLRAADQH